MTAVVQITDTLDAGGAERVAVNLANLLPRDRYRSYLCSTWREGMLADQVAPHVGRVCLDRKGRFDRRAVRALVQFNRKHEVRLLHAHASSLFIATVASLFRPRPAVLWHVHLGRYAAEQRSAWISRTPARGAAGVAAVTQPLAGGARRRLGVPAGRVWYVPNSAPAPAAETAPAADLPGSPERRIVCVAN